MRASKLIEELEQMIEKYGDCYVIYKNEENYKGAEPVEKIEIMPYHETSYFYID